MFLPLLKTKEEKIQLINMIESNAQITSEELTLEALAKRREKNNEK